MDEATAIDLCLQHITAAQSGGKLMIESGARNEPLLNRIVAAQLYPLLFARIGGAHVYAI